MSQTNPISSPQISRLLSLPAEIRHQIHQLLLPPCDYLCYHYEYCEKAGQDPIYTEYLLTCKQVNAEATQYLFKHNEFRFIHHKPASQWLRQIGARNASAVEALWLVFPLPQWNLASLETVFQEGTGLCSLRLLGSTTDTTEDRKSCVKQFLLHVKPCLDSHSSLNLATCPYPGAIQSHPCSTGWYSHQFEISFAANKNYVLLGICCIDLQSELQGIKNDSENQTFCCGL